MTREKRLIPAAAAGVKGKHRRFLRDALNPALIAKPIPHKALSKHVSYFEFVANENKKDKRLEFEVTTNKVPPPEFEFVPVGNPELTKACKDISRERGARIYIVSDARDKRSLVLHMHRVGHHVHSDIVKEAHLFSRENDGGWRPLPVMPEPLPLSQAEIYKQADRAIRDLFPRIPNPDRQTIVEHAFKKGQTFRGEPVVGLSEDLSLSRRVQLAVLAHIRHSHTRYDELLKETTYHNARRLVEPLCLDILVKWRGDEENGRDDLDEILREVVVISDDSSGSDGGSDSGCDDEDASNSESQRVGDVLGHTQPTDMTPPSRPEKPRHISRQPQKKGRRPNRRSRIKKHAPTGTSKRDRARTSLSQKGFKRYAAVKEAAMNEAWNQAVGRHQQSPSGFGRPSGFGHPADFGRPSDFVPSSSPLVIGSLTSVDRLVSHGPLNQLPVTGEACRAPGPPGTYGGADRYCQPPHTFTRSALGGPPTWPEERTACKGSSPPLRHANGGFFNPAPPMPSQPLLRKNHHEHPAQIVPVKPNMSTVPGATVQPDCLYRDFPIPSIEPPSSSAMRSAGRAVAAHPRQHMNVGPDSSLSHRLPGILPPSSHPVHRDSPPSTPIAVPEHARYSGPHPDRVFPHGPRQPPNGINGCHSHMFNPPTSLSSEYQLRPRVQLSSNHSDPQWPYLSSGTIGDRDHPIVVDDDRHLMEPPTPQRIMHNNHRPSQTNQQPLLHPHPPVKSHQGIPGDGQSRMDMRTHEDLYLRPTHQMAQRSAGAYCTSPDTVPQWVPKSPVPTASSLVVLRDGTGRRVYQQQNSSLPTSGNWIPPIPASCNESLRQDPRTQPQNPFQPTRHMEPRTVENHQLPRRIPESEQLHPTRRVNDMFVWINR